MALIMTIPTKYKISMQLKCQELRNFKSRYMLLQIFIHTKYFCMQNIFGNYREFPVITVTVTVYRNRSVTVNRETLNAA